MIVIVDDSADEIHLVGLDWADVFFLTGAVINTVARTQNEEIHREGDRLLEVLDAAAETVFKRLKIDG